MGLFDVFKKEGREKSSVDRAIKKITNAHVQSPDRYASMEKLRAMGTPEAILGLFQRFSVTASKGIEDEQEKEWVCETLIGMGDQVLEPLKRYALEGDTVSYPLRILESVANPEQILGVVDALLEKESPDYTRDPSKKIQIITWLGEWDGADNEEISRRLVPYLGDFDETVRFVTVESLALKPAEELAKGPLLDALLSEDEESRRLKIRIGEALAQVGWRVSERKQELAKLLDDELADFHLQHDKLVRKKGK